MIMLWSSCFCLSLAGRMWIGLPIYPNYQNKILVSSYFSLRTLEIGTVLFPGFSYFPPHIGLKFCPAELANPTPWRKSLQRALLRVRTLPSCVLFRSTQVRFPRSTISGASL